MADGDNAAVCPEGKVGDSAPKAAAKTRNGPRREVSIVWLITAALAVMLLVTVTGGVYVTGKLDESAELATENLALTEASDSHVAKVNQEVLPSLSLVMALEEAVNVHAVAFQLLALDASRGTDALKTASVRVMEAKQALVSSAQAMLSGELIAELEEYTGVVMDMTGEVFTEDDRNERVDLLYEAEDMEQELQAIIQRAATDLRVKSERWMQLAADNSSKARHHIETQSQLLKNIKIGAKWSLGFSLIVVVTTMLFLYWLLNRRLDRVVSYSKRVADGDFDAEIGSSSRDKIGIVAAAVGKMGQVLAQLVREQEHQTRLARDAQDKAEQENWMNRSLRSVSEATHGETRIDQLMDKALTVLCDRLEVAGAFVSEFHGDGASLLAACGSVDELVRESLVGESGLAADAARGGEAQWLDLPDNESFRTVFAGALNESRQAPIVMVLMFQEQPSDIHKRFADHVLVHLSVSLRAATQAQTLERNSAELRAKVDRMLSVVNAAAMGDLTREVDIIDTDTIGQMGQGLNGFFKELRAHIGTIALNAEGLTSASNQLTKVGRQISINAEATSDRASAVSTAAGEVSSSVETVAAAAEEMNAGLRDVSVNAAAASDVATRGVEIARTANATVAKLGESSNEIGNVIKMITTIAEQTNLLALNATIEAARAGEAGKGFAVVANEVKELAKETSQATEDISKKIETIQMDTRSAVEAIEKIGKIISNINRIQEDITSGMEKQTQTTDDIMHVVAGAATGSAEIAQSITSVSQVAHDTLSGATQAQEAAQNLSKMAVDLQHLVGRFSYETNADSRGSDGKEKMITLPPQTAASSGR
ncbi:MAG: methyl-accepting chemotaxis protein [Gammaproteobacteria bacterium]|nr:methyl-accepting chemotaxis protein [Gammaproteobacteria bacterium]